MILIVGGAGYIGSHINKLLNQKGRETLVLDNLLNGNRDCVKWGTFKYLDLKDLASLERLFQNYPIHAVMHFAAYTDVGESVINPQKYYRNNVNNTLNLLQAMLKYDIKYFIFSSTCATYGEPMQIPLTENHPLKPINPYGKSKYMVEQILEDYSNAYNFNYVSLRYFNAAGADPQTEIGEMHQPETHLIPLILDVALGKRESIKIYGTDYNTPDGTCIRDYIHVMDLAEAHLMALEYLEKSGNSQVFNLGNGKGFSVREVIETVEKVTGKDIKTVEADRRPGDAPILVGSSEKASKILGWQPKYKELEYIVETAWKWHQKLNNLY